MESATILTPPSFPSELSISQGYEIRKNIITISMYREKFYQFHVAQRQLFQPLNNLENGSFRKRENLQYKKVYSRELIESATILTPLAPA